jgi:hypothetical protein
VVPPKTLMFIHFLSSTEPAQNEGGVWLYEKNEGGVDMRSKLAKQVLSECDKYSEEGGGGLGHGRRRRRRRGEEEEDWRG